MLAILRSCSLVLVLVGMLFGVSDVGYAACPEDPGCTTEAEPAIGSAEEWLVSMANLLVEGLSFLTAPLTLLAGWLLTPDWVFGEFFGLRPALHQMWIFVSNIVYVIFALVTISIAFMNIVGQGKDTYQLKKALPRLVVSILLVPLSWPIVETVVSVSSILTASIMQLPWTLVGTTLSTSQIEIPEYRCILNFNTPTGAFFECLEGNKKKILDYFWNWTNPYGILSVYAYNIFSFSEIQSLREGNLTSVKTLVDLFWRLGLSFVFFFVFSLLIIGVVVALFARAVWLWIYAIGSPILALVYFYEWKLPGFETKDFNFMGLISLAMVPVYVWWALAFGLMFLAFVMGAKPEWDSWVAGWVGGASTVAHFSPQNDCEWNTNKLFKDFESDARTFDGGNFIFEPGDKCQVFTLGKSVQFLTIGNPPWITSSEWGPSRTSNDITQWPFGAILVKLLGLFVLWTVVMTAIKANAITKAIVEPVADVLGKVAQAAPLPVPGGSIAGAKWLAKAPQWALDSVIQTQTTTALSRGKRFLWVDGIPPEKITEIGNAIRTGSTTSLLEARNRISELIAKYGHSDPQVKPLMTQFMTEYKRKKDMAGFNASMIKGLGDGTEATEEQIFTGLKDGGGPQWIRMKFAGNNEQPKHGFNGGGAGTGAWAQAARTATPRPDVLAETNGVRTINIQGAPMNFSSTHITNGVMSPEGINSLVSGFTGKSMAEAEWKKLLDLLGVTDANEVTRIITELKKTAGLVT